MCGLPRRHVRRARHMPVGRAPHACAGRLACARGLPRGHVRRAPHRPVRRAPHACAGCHAGVCGAPRMRARAATQACAARPAQACAACPACVCGLPRRHMRPPPHRLVRHAPHGHVRRAPHACAGCHAGVCGAPRTRCGLPRSVRGGLRTGPCGVHRMDVRAASHTPVRRPPHARAACLARSCAARSAHARAACPACMCRLPRGLVRRAPHRPVRPGRTHAAAASQACCVALGNHRTELGKPTGGPLHVHVRRALSAPSARAPKSAKCAICAARARARGYFALRVPPLVVPLPAAQPPVPP